MLILSSTSPLKYQKIIFSGRCCKAVSSLLAKTPKSAKTVVADGAYDHRSAREKIKQKKAKALIPPPRNARFRGEEDERDDAVRLIRGLGNDEQARRLWGKLTGYSCRALVETAFSRMKGQYGERLFSKNIDNQRIETGLRCLLLNKMIKQNI